ncbi:MAG: sodium:proton antiporter [Burkholderiales bacterium]|nr:sodium:proton antiporter [Burkholderiales bacterium]
MNDDIALTIAGIGVVAIACQWLGWRLKLPSIVFLLIAGLIAGPVTGLVDPDELFGDLLFPLVSLCVAVILFEGSLTLRFAEIRGVERVVLRLITVGTAISWLSTTLLTRWLIDASWEVATLFGAVMVVTGPTVIVPMLRTVRPTAAVSNVLRWEGILIDPIGAALAILTYQFIIAYGLQGALLQTLLTLGKMVLAGVAIGALAGYAVGLALRRGWLPGFLHNFTVLGLVFGVFAISNAVEHETGLLAVTVMGLWLANMPGVHTDDILDFKESLSIFLISGLFIVLAARLDFSLFRSLGWSALWIFVAMQFVTRPLKVAVATIGSKLNWRERVLLGWIGPRGIVAAAISAVFGLQLTQAGHPQAGYLVPLSFMVIIGTVLLQGATAGWLAKFLGVSEPEPKGFVIVGANKLARAIALALRKVGYRSLLTDTSWDNLSAARHEGFATYYGNPVSEHADRHLELIGYGGLLGLSARAELNSLSVVRYRREFGDENVHALHSTLDEQPENLRIAVSPAGRALFGEDASYSRLSRMLSEGGAVTVTEFGEGETLETTMQKHPQAIPLFAVDPKGRLSVFTEARKPSTLAKGWTLVAIAPNSEAATDADADSGAGGAG